MGWGVPRRPKISNKLGIPNPREGSDGDIQVRQTTLGARIFAKIGGRWLSNLLYGAELDNPEIVLPRAWFKDGRTDNDDETIVKLPDFIHFGNLLGFTFNISLGSFAHHGWAWDTPGSGADVNRCEVYYQRVENAIYISNVGTSARQKQYKLLVFFK